MLFQDMTSSVLGFFELLLKCSSGPSTRQTTGRIGGHLSKVGCDLPDLFKVVRRIVYVDVALRMAGIGNLANMLLLTLFLMRFL